MTKSFSQIPTSYEMTTSFVILTVEKSIADNYLSCTVTQILWLDGALRLYWVALSFFVKDLLRVKRVSKEVSNKFQIS